MKALNRWLNKPIRKTNAFEKFLIALLAIGAGLLGVLMVIVVWAFRLLPVWLIIGVIYWLWG